MQRILSKARKLLSDSCPDFKEVEFVLRSFILWNDSQLSRQACRRFQRGGAAASSPICAQTALAALQHECSQAGHRGARGSQAWRSGHLGDSSAGESTGQVGVRRSWVLALPGLLHADRAGQVTFSPCMSADSNMGATRPLLPKTRRSHLSFGFMPQV